jgi:D-serine deaminase-like pyridoxal phosphate-dependent protein
MINYRFDKEEKIPSPALVYYRDHIIENTKKAIEIAGTADRMWPHVKTHKMAEMIDMQLRMGIRRFKCATVSEIRMVAQAGADHILWAYPVVGPNVAQFIKLVKEFPACTLYALEDDPGALEALAREAEAQGMTVNVLLDVNIGMNRTGMAPEKVVP